MGSFLCRFGAALVALASVSTALRAQVISITDDFNDGNDVGWVHYAPIATPPFNAAASWTFPSDGSGGFGYRIYGGPPQDTTGGPTRVGAFRNDAAYSDFFQAIDVLTFDDVQESAGFLAGRITTPGFLTTRGYLVGYIHQAVNAGQGAFATVGFDSELTIFYPDYYTGGVAPMPNLDPSRRYRMTFSGEGPLLKGAIYDRTDLLEPVVRIASFDQMFSSGNLGIGVLNLNDTRSADFTFDNYYSMGSANGPVGFPGVAQVTDLVPGPNALFYPHTNGVTFHVRTFSTAQVAVNSIRFFINGSNVTSQLVITNATTLFEAPGSHYGVRYGGALPSNTIVQAQIIANDTTGRGTTNNWTFDTFTTNGVIIVEAEDFNFGGGQFIDNPPVSGVDSNGAIVNPAGYYKRPGIAGVDFSDTKSSANTNEFRYRDDPVGTIQDRRNVRDTARADHIAANVGDYQVWELHSGEWLNYTRTFPAARFNVYLRTSSQTERNFRVDEVTSSPASSPQSTAIRGLFNVPNTGSATRFRYVPLSDVFGNPQVMSLGGVRTLRLTASNVNDDAQLNYILLVPSAVAARPAWVASLTPARNSTSADPEQEIEAIILNADTTVVTNTIQVRFDGSNVTSGITRTSPTSEGSGVTVRFRPGVLVPNSTHTVELVFGDSNGAFQTNQWSFAVKNMVTLPAYLARAVAAGPRGFAGRIHKARNDAPDTDFENTFARAESQLAGTLIDAATGQPYNNEAEGPLEDGSFNEPGTINYEQAGVFAGLFSSDRAFPNINPASYGGDPNHIAMAVTTYLQLNTGPYRFGVRSDDGFKVTAGFNASSKDVLVGSFEGGRPSQSTEFEFFVSAPGLYGFRLLFFEGVGGADVEWYSANRLTGEPYLINASDGIPAFTDAGFRITDITRTPTNIMLSLATAPAHGFTLEYKTNLNAATWTLVTNGMASSFTTKVSVPGTNSSRFFRLRVD
jgi:hypothetical protein